jgi:uncharacterized metal-binding protein YceD (DUF177 family)
MDRLIYANSNIQICLEYLKGQILSGTSHLQLSEDVWLHCSRRLKRFTWSFNGEYSTRVYFEQVFQSFTDPERPTEEEFVMFRLQYGVDWIVEPLDLYSEGNTK